ncbi:MAG: EF-hand domain-containing protein [Sulfurimonas sp.]|uniref:EF-hand domain-containing protein n=1 Tax=Sulfurimonas sp. TaxID=2022749 RepID=UPI0028CD25AA|nr:EF-hand domain-containing protein [Sulfurimonas sp.]MDT8338100.1 EF-hand domain-containing protein [Sulfurimonas sp.]
MQKFTKYIRLSLIPLSLLLVAPVGALAQNMGRDMPTFESFDLNSDGTLTESELNEARDKRVQERKEDGRMLRNTKSHYEFSKMDADEDGLVNKKEFLEHQTRRKR